MSVLTHQGIQFNYLDTGTNGVPFVFQHGLGGDCSQPFGLFAPPAWLRMLCLDCRGHGNTHPLGPIESLSFNEFADDVVTLLDALTIERAIVGGISMGAGIALNFACRHPGRLLGLVLVRPAWLSEPMPARSLYELVAALIRQCGPEQGLRVFLASPKYAELSRTAPAAARSLVEQFRKPRAEETAVKFERLSGDVPYQDAASLRSIDVPTLVVVTGQDPVHPYDYGILLSRQMPRASFVEVTAKSVNEEEHQRQVQAAMDDFLSKHFLPERGT
jgi:pimeloyl-ACP methyl ester carboxylesterase